jgi:hypothetical protein
MTRLVFASCLLLILSSCGIAGLAFTAASGAKDVYDGVNYAKEKGWFEKKTIENTRKNSWYQIHKDGIWYGTYMRVERTILLRIYGNPRDKEDYE